MTSLYFTGLGWQVDDAALASACAHIGDIARAWVLLDPITGRTCGTGFVTFRGPVDPTDAPTEVAGRPVRANPALGPRVDGEVAFLHTDGRYRWFVHGDGREALFDDAEDPTVDRIDDPSAMAVRDRLRAEVWPPRPSS